MKLAVSVNRHGRGAQCRAHSCGRHEAGGQRQQARTAGSLQQELHSYVFKRYLQRTQRAVAGHPRRQQEADPLQLIGQFEGLQFNCAGIYVQRYGEV